MARVLSFETVARGATCLMVFALLCVTGSWTARAQDPKYLCAYARDCREFNQNATLCCRPVDASIDPEAEFSDPVNACQVTCEENVATRNIGLRRLISALLG